MYACSNTRAKRLSISSFSSENIFPVASGIPIAEFFSKAIEKEYFSAFRSDSFMISGMYL